MTITSPVSPYASRSTSVRAARVVPPAATWDGGLPYAGASSRTYSRSLDRTRSVPTVDSGGGVDHKDSWLSLAVGALFGLTLTFGVVLGTSADSLDTAPVNSYSLSAPTAAH